MDELNAETWRAWRTILCGADLLGCAPGTRECWCGQHKLRDERDRQDDDAEAMAKLGIKYP